MMTNYYKEFLCIKEGLLNEVRCNKENIDEWMCQIYPDGKEEYFQNGKLMLTIFPIYADGNFSNYKGNGEYSITIKYQIHNNYQGVKKS